jgi:hypothetical protein
MPAALTVNGLVIPGFQVYVDPPDPVKVTELPEQNVVEPDGVINAIGLDPTFIIFSTILTIQPLTSLILQVYDPTPSGPSVCVNTAVGFQLYVYDPVPPDGLAVTDPLDRLQVALVDVDVAVGPPVLPIVTVVFLEQELASVT